MNAAILISAPWKCHDGWASTVFIVRDGEIDYDAAAACRQKYKLWYRSARTREGAEKRQLERIKVAQELNPGAPVIHAGTPEANALFTKEAA